MPFAVSFLVHLVVDRLEAVGADEFRSEAEDRGIHLESVDVERESGVFVVRAVVYATSDISADALDVLRGAIEADTGMTVRLKTRVLRMEFFDTGPDDTDEKQGSGSPPDEPE